MPRPVSGERECDSLFYFIYVRGRATVLVLYRLIISTGDRVAQRR